jgi:hypothetical protein
MPSSKSLYWKLMALDRMAPVPNMAHPSSKNSPETFAQPHLESSGRGIWLAVDDIRDEMDATGSANKNGLY